MGASFVMKEKILEILNDEDSYIPAEWLIYSKSNSAISIVKTEIDELLKQLKIAVKAGEFDGYFEREAPQLFETLSLKREELIALLQYERTKEKRIDVYKVDIKPFVMQAEQVGVYAPNPAPMLAEPTRTTTKSVKQNKNLISSFRKSYADTNFYMVIVLAIILVSVQMLFNFTFEHRLKSNVQETIVQNLENRLRLAENQNINLAHNLTQLKQRQASATTHKTSKNGVYLLKPVKFKQDPLLAKIYEKDKEKQFIKSKKIYSKNKSAPSSQRKVYTLAKAKPKNKLSSAKVSRYSRGN